MPDFDIDFCQERREEVIAYVQSRYGDDRVAQIITFGSLQARAVLRDVGRVMQLPLGQVDRLAKMIPNNPAAPVTLAKAIEIEPRLQAARREDEAVAQVLEIALQLEGLYRNASTHAAGVVIADRPLTELAPLYRDPRSSLPATQFNMKWVESAGLVKFDFLGLKTLTVVRRAVEYPAPARAGLRHRRACRWTTGPPTSSARAGHTVGVFQMEGQGMRDTLRKLRPGIAGGDHRPDLALSARADGFDRRVRRLQDGPPAGADHGRARETSLARDLRRHRLPGTGDADRPHPGRLFPGRGGPAAPRHGQEEEGGDGPPAGPFPLRRRGTQGVPDAEALDMFERMAKFAGYGFNKCHAAPYALIAYQTAWLKANAPVEFFAASMSLDASNTDKLAVFYQDAKRSGVAIAPPDVNRSGADFEVGGRQGALCAGRGAQRRPRGHGSRGRRARRRRAVRRSDRLRRARRSAPGQQARAREPRQGGRLRFASTATAPRSSPPPTP